MRSCAATGVIWLILCAPCILADEVVFKNGDHLTGEIKQMVDGKLIFQSDMAGEVTIDMSNIQTFSSDAPVAVHLQDGTVFSQRVLGSEPNHFAIEGSETLQAQEFELMSISLINPPEKPQPRWTGDISAGFTSTHGNTKTQAISGSANLSKRTERDRTQFSADYGRGRQEDPDTGEKKTTEDWWRTKAKYDYFLTKKLYTYFDGRYEKDAVAELDRRVIAGSGLGYQWIESEKTKFSTEAGIAHLYEKFDNQTESNSEVSAQAGYYFDTKLAKNLKFIHNLTYYPSTDRFSDYFLTSTAELRTNLSKRFFLNFKTIFDYDATPAVDAHKTDVKYIFGLGYGF
jgi:putative salt-induced outer membrane protein YdiY